MKLSDSAAGGFSALLKLITLLFGLILVKIQLNYLGIINFGRWTNVATLMSIALLFDPGRANSIRKEISVHGLNNSKESIIDVIAYYRNISLILTVVLLFFWPQINKIEYLRYVIVFLPYIFLLKIVNIIFLSTQRSYFIYFIDFAIVVLQGALWYAISILGFDQLLFIHFLIPLLLYFCISIYVFNNLNINFLLILCDLKKINLKSNRQQLRYLIMQIWHVISVYSPLWLMYISRPVIEHIGFTYKMYLILYGLFMAIMSPLWSRVSNNSIKDSRFQFAFFKKTMFLSIVGALIWIITIPFQFKVFQLIEPAYIPTKLDTSVAIQFAILGTLQVPIVFMAGNGLKRSHSILLFYCSIIALIILMFLFLNIELLLIYFSLNLFLLITYFLYVYYVYKSIKDN